jgi:PAS domain S-box-containing protein
LNPADRYFSTLIEHMSDVILIVDSAGVIRYTSPSAERSLGYRPEEGIGKNSLEFVHPDDVPLFLGAIKNRMLNPTAPAKRVEIRIRHKDGSWRYMDGISKCVTDSSGEISLIINAQDVTDRKLAEQKVIASEQSLQAILAASPIGIGRVKDRTVEWVNESFCRMSGYDLEESKGKSTRMFFRTDEEFRATGKMLYGQGQAEYKFVRKDGSILDVLVQTAPVDNGSFIFTLSDITERLRTEKALRESEERLRLKLDTILSPGSGISDEELINVIDAPAIQSCMDALYKLTNMGLSIVDRKGNIIVSTGWEDICAKYHRVHPETARNCIESNLCFAQNPPEGTYLAYKCKNNMWDVFTPLKIAGKHVGNVFFGQFFYDDENVDYEIFARQAEKYGFDKEQYISAAKRVRRFSRDKVDRFMNFLSKFSALVSKLSYSNLQLARAITEQKRVTEALQANELKYRTLFDTAQDAIFILKDGKFADCNMVASRMFQCTKKQLAGRYPYDFSPPFQPDGRRSSEKAMEKIHRALAGEDQLFEWRHCRYDQTPFDAEVSLNRVALGDEIVLQAIVRDITDRKQAEESLLISETRYRTLFDDSPVALWEEDFSAVREYFESIYLSGVSDIGKYFDEHPEAVSHAASLIKVIDVNKAAVALFGASNKQQLVDNLKATLGEETMGPLRRGFVSLFQGAREFESEVVNFGLDGRKLHLFVKCAVIPSSGEMPMRMLVSFSDITERKEAEQALRESEEKYRDIFERAVEGIFQSTPEGRFINVNPSFAHMFGYDSPEELVTSPVNNSDRLYANHRERLLFIEIIKKSDAIASFEHQLVRKDGKPIWVSVKARTVRNPDGTVLYYEGTCENITERKQAEEERAKLQSQLRQSQKMEAIGTLAGGVAHDFNNILTVLSGYGTLLQMKMNKTNPLRAYVDHILSASEKATNLTQSLLAFSRQRPISLSSVNLNDVVRGTEKLLKRLLTEDITLKTLLDAGEHTVMVDITQIDQILFNLATNARDAMPRGGTLTVQTGLINLDRESIQMHGISQHGRYALLSVSDTGVGMDEETKDKLFVPFFTTKEVGKGTGLGLSTVYGIVRQHNGHINVYSELGMGTTFRIYLPRVETEFREENQGPKQIKRGKETLLVAEDNNDVRRLITEMLTGHGYTVVEASDGEDALQKFKKNNNIDLLILDSVMPRKNGREAYDEISKIEPGVRVIFTSGYTRDVVLDKGIEEKQFDFISKPLSRETLLEKVREVLDRPSPRTSAL